MTKPVPRTKRVIAVYQLKVTLRDARPPIWRRIQVRNHITLERLHRIFQTVMGWTDSHMHQFVVGQTCYGSSALAEGGEAKSESKTRLFEVLRKRKDRMIYEYDFGDSWEHVVDLEEILPVPAGGKYPWVVTGKRACPPEDIGGVGGYVNFLEAISDPSHPDHAELLEWCGASFDPNAFDAQAINRRFHGGWARRGGSVQGQG